MCEYPECSWHHRSCLLTSVFLEPCLCMIYYWKKIIRLPNFNVSIFWSLSSLVLCLPEHLACVTCQYEWELLFTRVKTNFVLEWYPGEYVFRYPLDNSTFISNWSSQAVGLIQIIQPANGFHCLVLRQTLFELCFLLLQKIRQRLEEDFATIQTLSSDPRLIHPDLPPNVFGRTKGTCKLASYPGLLTSVFVACSTNTW